MIINGKKLLELAPIKDMLDHSEIANGVSYGLSESGYDIRCANDIVFRPKEHNGRFRLDVSMEEFQMPNNLLGSVCDKSTFARAGVSVKNTKIKPGWRGHLTIELFYEKDDDFTIKAGTSVCQIIFEETYESVAYTGIYQDQGSDPEVYRLYPHQEKALKECISSSPLEESTLSDKPLKEAPVPADVEKTKPNCCCDSCVKASKEILSAREEKIAKIFNILNIKGDEWSEIYSSKSDEYIDSKLEALEWLLDNSDHLRRNDRYQVLLDGASEYLIYKSPDFLNKVWECTKCVDSNGKLDRLYLASAFYKEIDDFYKNHRESNTLNTPLAEWAVSLAVGYFTYRRTVLKQLDASMDENREVLKNMIDDIYGLFTSDRNRSHYLEKLAEMDSEYL